MNAQSRLSASRRLAVPVVGGPRQEIHHPNRRVRRRNRDKDLMWTVDNDAAVTRTDGIAKDFDLIMKQVHDPILPHAGSGVGASLLAPVVPQRGVRDFYDQQRVGRLRVPESIIRSSLRRLRRPVPVRSSRSE
jgi:hypothetical protein